MKFKNMEIVGTSHIAEESVKKVTDKIKKEKPEIVCVELDRQRLHALMSNQKKSSLNPKLIFQIGVVGYLFLLIGGYVQKKLGKIVNIDPGSDMKAAVIAAKEIKSKIGLIDQNVQMTLKKLSKTFTFKEVLRIGGDIIKAIFGIGPKINVKFNLKGVPDEKVINQMMGLLKERYPSIYNVLIDERNKIMARKLIVLSKKNPNEKILSVVGAGHKSGMIEYLKKFYDKIEIV